MYLHFHSIFINDFQYCATVAMVHAVFQPHNLCINPPCAHFVTSPIHICLAAFEDVGVDLKRPIIATCGSAVVAGVLAFGLDRIGIKAPVYDVSFSLRERRKDRRNTVRQQ